jgi:prevent-host-death family protein
MKTWQVQDAKQRFSELVQQALDEGPQLVTRRGKPAVVIVAADKYESLAGGSSVSDFKSFLESAPDFSLLELDGAGRDLPRAVDL